MPPNPETGFNSLSDKQLGHLRNQLRSFVGGKQQELDDTDGDCQAGSGAGHNSHCDGDGWA